MKFMALLVLETRIKCHSVNFEIDDCMILKFIQVM